MPVCPSSKRLMRSSSLYWSGWVGKTVHWIVQIVNSDLKIHGEEFLSVQWLCHYSKSSWLSADKEADFRGKRVEPTAGWKELVLRQQGMMGKLFWLIWLRNSLRLCARYLPHSMGFKEIWRCASINDTWYKAHHHDMTQNMDFTKSVFFFFQTRGKSCRKCRVQICSDVMTT